MNFTIELAGVPIGIHHTYAYIAALCQEYRTDRVPEFAVSVTEQQIEAERTLTEGQFPIELCESTCIHREIVKALVKYGVILMHSAVVAVDGTAYVFMAKSGVGKSTHIRLWQEVFGKRALVVNGDKPMFSFVGNTWMVHGSPWRGKEQLGEPVSMPVGGICLLERGSKNVIAPAKEAEVVGRVFHQVLLPKNAEDLTRFMEIMNRMIKEVPFYCLQCNMEQEAALVAFEGMSRNTVEKTEGMEQI